MKKISKIIGSLILTCGILFSACSDMLDVDSDRYLATDDNNLTSPNDSVYSLWGILQKFRELGDRYVVVGELRADLMDITENSDSFLIKINNIDYNNIDEIADNPYLSTKEYFAVINNCNYYLSKVDPNSTGEGSETKRLEYAAIKGIRAWTYWQLGLNYEEVPYIDKPILTIEDMNADYDMLNQEELARTLIEDLLPYEALRYPDHTVYGSNMENAYSMSTSLIPMAFLLGDLYLWLGEYETAATYYHKLISGNSRPNYTRMPYDASDFYTDMVFWGANPMLVTDDFPYINSWSYLFTSTSLPIDMLSVISERKITEVGISNPYAVMDISYLCAPLTSGVYQYKLKPSQVALDTWNDEVYFYSTGVNTTDYEEIVGYGGDLRGTGGNLSAPAGSYGRHVSSGDTLDYIRKYFSTSFISAPSKVYLYRNATLYLRLAEAANRANKPSVALTALKYGLSDSTLVRSSVINPSEVANKPSYLNFNYLSLQQQISTIGLHARGSGLVDRDTVHYVFNDTHITLQDSIEFVEDLLLKEYALETAFEGNRFYDLMRFAKRRGDTSILADRVGRKNPIAGAKLINEKNWYFPADFDLPEPEESQNETESENP